MVTASIYLVTNRLNGKRYVGQTKIDVSVRWSQHVSLANRGRGNLLHAAIRKYGASQFDIEVLESGIPFNKVDSSEAAFIRSYNSIECGYNLNTWDGGCRVVSEEVKKKMSISHIGQTSPNKGRKMSEEQKRKISESKLGSVGYWKGKTRPRHVIDAMTEGRKMKKLKRLEAMCSQ
jgi:group I intron endonuclease